VLERAADEPAVLRRLRVFAIRTRVRLPPQSA